VLLDSRITKILFTHILDNSKNDSFGEKERQRERDKERDRGRETERERERQTEREKERNKRTAVEHA
jgi:hypothetical protein